MYTSKQDLVVTTTNEFELDRQWSPNLCTNGHKSKHYCDLSGSGTEGHILDPAKMGRIQGNVQARSHTSHLTWLGRMGAGTGGGFIYKQIILLFTKTCIVFVVLFKICFIAYIYLSIFIYLSESLAWACCSLVLGFAASWIITLSSCPSIQPWERGEVLITFRRLYVCSYLWEQH